MGKKIDQAEIQARWNLADLDAASPEQRKVLIHCAVWQALDRPSWDAFKLAYRGSSASHQVTLITRNARRLFETAIQDDHVGGPLVFAEWVERVAERRPTSASTFYKAPRSEIPVSPTTPIGDISAVVEARFYVYANWVSRSASRPFSPKLSIQPHREGHDIGLSSTVGPYDRIEIHERAFTAVSDYVRRAVAGTVCFLGTEIQKESEDRDLPDRRAPALTAEPIVRSSVGSTLMRSKAERLQSLIELAAFDFLFLHEMAHIYRGHLDLHAARFRAGNPLLPQEMQALDFDADLFATAAILNLSQNKGIGLFSSEDLSFFNPDLGQAIGPNANAVALAMFAAFSVVGLEVHTAWSRHSSASGHIQSASERCGAVAYAFIVALSYSTSTIDQAVTFVLATLKSARESFCLFGPDRSEFATLGDDILERNRSLLKIIDNLSDDLQPFERGHFAHIDLQRAA